MATFSLTQNNIQFTKVNEISSYPISLPYGPSAYENASEQLSSRKLINVVDIDWNGAKPGIGEGNNGIIDTGLFLKLIQNIYLKANSSSIDTLKIQTDNTSGSLVVTLQPNTQYKLLVGNKEVIFKTPDDSDSTLLNQLPGTVGDTTHPIYWDGNQFRTCNEITAQKKIQALLPLQVLENNKNITVSHMRASEGNNGTAQLYLIEKDIYGHITYSQPCTASDLLDLLQDSLDAVYERKSSGPKATFIGNTDIHIETDELQQVLWTPGNLTASTSGYLYSGYSGTLNFSYVQAKYSLASQLVHIDTTGFTDLTIESSKPDSVQVTNVVKNGRSTLTVLGGNGLVRISVMDNGVIIDQFNINVSTDSTTVFLGASANDSLVFTQYINGSLASGSVTVLQNSNLCEVVAPTIGSGTSQVTIKLSYGGVESATTFTYTVRAIEDTYTVYTEGVAGLSNSDSLILHIPGCPAASNDIDMVEHYLGIDVPSRLGFEITKTGTFGIHVADSSNGTYSNNGTLDYDRDNDKWIFTNRRGGFTDPLYIIVDE